MKWKTAFATYWVGLTVVYLILFQVALLFKGFGLGRLVYAIGIFVPYGFYNLLGVIGKIQEVSLFPVLALIIFVIALVTADSIARTIGITSTIGKVIFNLVVLAVITLLVDLSLWGHWNSGLLFIGLEPRI